MLAPNESNGRTNAADAVLQLRDVTKFYGAFCAVDHLSFSLVPGSICGFLGPNGAGKTTTIRMVLEIIKPTSGTISVLGHPSALQVRQRIGYLPEEKGLYKKMKTWAVIAYFATLKGLSRKAAKLRAYELLERYGLKDFAEKPTDQSASLEPVINSTLEKAHQRHVLEALQDYARKYAAAPAAPGAASWLSVENFISQGGEEGFLQRLRPSLKPGAPPFKTPRRVFQRTQLPASLNTNAEFPALAQELKPYLRGDRKIQADGQPVDLSVAILIPRDIEKQIVRPQSGKTRGTAENKGIEFWSTDVASMKGGSGLAHDVEQAVNAEVRRREYVSRGMDAAAIRQVEQTYAPFLSFNPKKEAGQEAVNTTDVIKQWLPSGFVYLLWLAIFVIVQMLLNNTIEEKSNRIIEVLLSSVTPGELMMGKLFGIAATGLTMVGAWMLALFGILIWKAGGASEIAGQMLTVIRTSNLVPLFCVYFLLGYLMYAAFILSIGSVCNTIKEAQSYMGLLTMVMMVPLLTMTFIPKDPNGMLARLLSWIPLYTPFTMMNRANADPPLVDLFGTLILLVLTTSVALWMSGKIFRIGVLRTGQPPRIIEMLRWVKG